MQNTLASHIESTPDVCGGKPRVAGRRITVHHIAVWHERLGRSADEIAREHQLSLAQVHAALAYYFDNRAEIDAEIRAVRAQLVKVPAAALPPRPVKTPRKVHDGRLAATGEAKEDD